MSMRSHIPSRFKILATLILPVMLTGCASSSNDATVKGLSSNDADKLNSDRSPFDSSKDPPISADTRFAAGRFAEVQGQYPAALGQYSEALRIDPKHEPSLYRLGVIQAQMKQYGQAVDTWKRYIAATNGSATGYSNLGFCYELSNRTEEAEAAYRTGISKDPKCAPCRVNYGLMLARLNRVDEARGQLSAVLAPAEVHYNIASVFEQQGKKDLARAEYRTALELNPNLDEARTRLAALN